MSNRHLLLVAFILWAISLESSAQVSKDHDAKVSAKLGKLNTSGKVVRSAIGVTRHQTTIPSLIDQRDFDYHGKPARILIVGGLDGSDKSVSLALSTFDWFHKSAAAKPYHDTFSVSCVPIANPDGWATKKGSWNLTEGNVALGFPPEGGAYSNQKNSESAYLWRWIGTHAPDIVIDVRSAPKTKWYAVKAGANQELAKLLDVDPRLDEHELAANLPQEDVCKVGAVAAVRVDATDKAFLPELMDKLAETTAMSPSAAHREIQKRQDRTPRIIAEQLTEHYGNNLNSVAYIPALALVARVELTLATRDSKHFYAVEEIVAPYFKREKPTLGKRVSGSNLSGHLIFGLMARETGYPEYIELAQNAADLGFDADGKLKASMPFHSEMSDAVFMGCPILVQVGSLKNQRRYYEMAARHLRFMLKLNLRKDGIHRHSPLDNTAWGRGNGFPALGVALCLSDLPKDDPLRAEFISVHRSHLESLAKHQDPNGMWHQIIDHPGSYRELTSTCMITIAMARGVRLGWLSEEKYTPIIQRAWNAIKIRIAVNGELVDVCTGTGKQKNLQAYFDRTAILGKDARGGAMSLMVSTEMMHFQKWMARE